MRALYQGWIGSQNLGDEAIYQACVMTMPALRWTGMPLDQPRSRRAALRNDWHRWVTKRSRHGRALLGGGTVINRTPAWLDQYRLLRRATGRPVPVFGAGVADPAFWSRVPGWQSTLAEWRDELGALPEVGVRGPRSRCLLRAAGLANVTVAGDPALAFHRGAKPLPPAGRRTVAVNAGRASGLMWGSEERALAQLADAVRRLVTAGFRVRFFPMWHGDSAVCREVANAAGLGDDVVAPLELDAAAFLKYLDQFDVVVSLKLHGAVLAAAAGVPFVALEYQPKVRDFVESIGWERYCLRTDELAGPAIVALVRALYEELPARRAELDGRVGELAPAFRAYARRTEELILAA